MLRKIEKLEKKNVFHYDYGVTIQQVFGMSYTNGNDDIHITINGGSSTSGENWDGELNLPSDVIQLLELVGARKTKKHIYYGKCYVPKNSSLSKLKDYMALATMIETELANK